MNRIVKMTLKITKKLRSDLEESDPELILYKLHLYLEEFGKHPLESDLGIRLVKTIVNELVACLRENIWGYLSLIDQDKELRNSDTNQLIKYVKHFLVIQQSLAAFKAAGQNPLGNPQNQMETEGQGLAIGKGVVP